MTPEDLIRIRHMLDAVKEVLEFTKNKSCHDFVDDRLLTLAVIKELEIIGEAASKLSTEFRINHSEIQWIDIIGMRNRLTHGYFDIDLDLVWITVLEDLPTLQEQLDKIVWFDENAGDHEKWLLDTCQYFSNTNKFEREKWVCSHFLNVIGIEYKENELSEGSSNFPDVIFRDANFEIKESMDEEYKRDFANKLELRRYQEEKYDEIVKCYLPKTINTEDVVSIVNSLISKYNEKYSANTIQNIDLLIYLNRDESQIMLPNFAPLQLEQSSWRSISVVTNNAACVLKAEDNAPDFIKNVVFHKAIP